MKITNKQLNLFLLLADDDLTTGKRNEAFKMASKMQMNEVDVINFMIRCNQTLRDGGKLESSQGYIMAI